MIKIRIPDIILRDILSFTFLQIFLVQLSLRSSLLGERRYTFTVGYLANTCYATTFNEGHLRLATKAQDFFILLLQYRTWLNRF